MCNLAVSQILTWKKSSICEKISSPLEKKGAFFQVAEDNGGFDEKQKIKKQLPYILQFRVSYELKPFMIKFT